ncbi:hypothetical protein [Paractinoplanes lichenicola]|uniref:Uncharacterized protein n=1 Tax=Paractinoplanes lichenicola TaxID=2802976 RepID=A0ABS1VDN4_9ACTN|nr:hypothetical protein [Actinoplanes lichenicola]MBL7252787.1 hypothetical protein [Actinoplanes lichenicola]
MDLLDPLHQAAALVPDGVASATGVTLADAVEYLEHRELEVAHGILTELGEAFPAGTAYWELLAASAAEMNLPRAWCLWRAAETRHGIIRADLQLFGPDRPGARRVAIPADGVARPLWDIGLVMPEGHPDLRIARIWVEGGPELAAGGRGPVRLAPLGPEGWRHLRPGDRITMHEQSPPAGIATVTQVSFPA